MTVQEPSVPLLLLEPHSGDQQSRSTALAKLLKSTLLALRLVRNQCSCVDRLQSLLVQALYVLTMLLLC
jgi:hypothetical protein